MAVEKAIARLDSAGITEGAFGNHLNPAQLANVEVSDHFIQLKVGQWCQGIYEGLGPEIELSANPATGEIVHKASHRFRLENGRGTFIIMEKVGLKRLREASYTGKTLLIQRGDDVVEGVKRIGTYTIGIVKK